MDKVFREKDLRPITHKEFNEFIKGKGFKGRNNYKLRNLKAMFGFKTMITGSPVTISSDGMEPTRFDSTSKASTSTGIPYILPYMLRKIPGKGPPQQPREHQSTPIEFTLMEKNIQ